jgi:hypothetical protein
MRFRLLLIDRNRGERPALAEAGPTILGRSLMNERHEILRSGSFVDAAISVASFIVELAGRSVYSIGESSDRVRPEDDTLK